MIGGRRPGQPARGRSPRRPPGPARRSAGPARPRHPRRARLPALRPNRRPAAVPPRQPALRAHLDHRHHQPDLRRMAVRLRRRQDDHRAPRSSDAPLRDHRDRKRLLALQESVLKATDPPAWFAPRLPGRPGRPGGPTGTSHARSAASRVVGASARARASPMDYLYDLRRASPKGSTLHADRGSMFNAD